MTLFLDHSAFLNKLRENPADTAGWLVYADWLDERNDPTGTFVRRSLDFSAGLVPVEDGSAHTQRFYELAARAHPKTRKMLGAYRASLPVRLQVCARFLVGHNPPRDMFGYARTIIFVAVLAGRLTRGTWLRSADDTWQPTRPVVGMEASMKAVDEINAGTAKSTIGLFYLGHHPLPVGTILVEGPAPELDLIG